MTLEDLRQRLATATDPRHAELLRRQIAYEEAHPDWREPNWFDRLCEGT